VSVNGINRKTRRRHSAIEARERRKLVREDELRKSGLILLRGEEWKEVATPILINYLRSRIPMQTIGEYCIVSKKAEAWSPTITGTNSICWDAFCGLILACNGVAIGCIGYSIVGKKVIVQQIQGRKGREAHLRIFEWDLMLLDIVVALATMSGFVRVDVQPGHRNKWLNTERLPSFLRLYDGNAKKLGFANPDKISPNFYLALTS